MKIIVTDEVLKDAGVAVRNMLSQKVREQKLSGISGNMTVLISDHDPEIYLESYEFEELGVPETVVPEEYQNDKVYLVAQSLL